MELLKNFLDFFMHLDQHMAELIANYGNWIYAILFLIIFVETGLVIFPLLPGDSLLFTAGLFCAGLKNENGELITLNLFAVLGLLSIAAVVGDALNYYFGKRIGLKIVALKFRSKAIINPKYLDKTATFYQKYGAKTIIIARFVPIVRTFAPFVAGIGKMPYKDFLKYNIIGAFAWITGLTLLGYFFGNLPIVKNNFELVIFGIIGLSILPMLFEIIRSKTK